MNVYTIKKFLMFFLLAFIPIMISLMTRFFVPLKDVFTPILAGAGVGVLMVIVAHFFLKHPFSELIEGSGLLLKDINSSGRIKNYIAKVNLPLVKLREAGKEYSTIFDRGIVAYEDVPIKADYGEDDKYAYYRVPKMDVQKSVFAENNYPCIIWNGKIKAPLTKDALNGIETSTIVDHQILYLNHKVDDLSSHVRDFARYIVEQFKPKKQDSIFTQKWFLILIVIIVIVMIGILLAPTIMKVFSSSGGLAGFIPTTAITPAK